MSADNSTKRVTETSPDHPNPSSLRNLIVSLKNTLRFHQLSGITHYPATADLQHFLRPNRPIPARRVQRTVQKHPTEPVRVTAQPQPPPAPPTKALTELTKDILSCCSCSQQQVTRRPIAGRGPIAPRLMVIGDRTFTSRNKEGKSIFGTKEDEMLWKMMGAIGLSQNNVYVSNCIKCPLIKLEDEGRSCAANCLPHLKMEIQAIAPSLILVMGELAAQLLLGSNEPLHRLRGKFRSHELPNKDKHIPILATYHPRFLLANEEMKKITWVDLQLVQNRLKRYKK